MVSLKSHHKVTLILGLIMAILLTSVYFYLDNTLKNYTFKRIRQDLVQEVALARMFLEQVPASAELDDVADNLGRKTLARVTIIAPDGTVAGDSRFDGERLRALENHGKRPEVIEARKIGVGESRRYSFSVNDDLLYVAMPYGLSNPPGVVRLSLPLADIANISNHLKRFLWISLMIFFIFALFVSHLASILITQPIARISEAAQAIASGDFSRKISLKQNDEISDLAKAVNFMSDQIRTRMAEVTAAKSRLEAVFLSMAEGVMVTDADGKILLINETLKKILKVEHETQGRRPIEVIRNIEVQDIVDQIQKTGVNVQGREMVFYIPEEKILRVYGAPVLRDGKSEGGVLVFHDITDLRRLERVRKDFVANVSHELRTPVASIKGYSETLLDGAMEDREHARDFLKIIYSESDRLAKLVNDLLELARHESGQAVLDFKPCRISKILDWVMSGLAMQIKQNNIKVEINIPDHLPQVKADDSAVSQILFNLVENAIKYNHPGGRITISASEKQDSVETVVSDTGLGIPSDDLPRIFERFYRVDKAHSRDIGGTGLGLSIVKHIIQAHSGEIHAESILGKGSRFRFTLPKA